MDKYSARSASAGVPLRFASLVIALACLPAASSGTVLFGDPSGIGSSVASIGVPNIGTGGYLYDTLFLSSPETDYSLSQEFGNGDQRTSVEYELSSAGISVDMAFDYTQRKPQSVELSTTYSSILFASDAPLDGYIQGFLEPLDPAHTTYAYLWVRLFRWDESVQSWDGGKPLFSNFQMYRGGPVPRIELGLEEGNYNPGHPSLVGSQHMEFLPGETYRLRVDTAIGYGFDAPVGIYQATGQVQLFLPEPSSGLLVGVGLCILTGAGTLRPRRST